MKSNPPLFGFCSCASSSAAKADLPFSQKRLLGHRYTSSHPENCFFPLPSSSHSDRRNVDLHQNHAGQRSSPADSQPSASSVQMPGPHSSKTKSTLMDFAKTWSEPDADQWCSGAGEEQAAVPETASGGSSDAQDDSTLSAYDNLEGACQREGMADIKQFEADCPEGLIAACEEEEEEEPEGAWQTPDSSSSWSSCEVLPLDESRDEADMASADVSPKRPQNVPSGQISEEESSHDEEQDKNEDEEDDEDDVHPNSPASCSLPSPVSTGSSEVFLPSGPPDVQGPELHPQPRNTHFLLAELQLQMARQKAEYQARIHR